ncbi:hypothetical protein GYB22_11905 [bacterium]|nr:hypothetical protein [bacterium]
MKFLKSNITKSVLLFFLMLNLQHCSNQSSESDTQTKEFDPSIPLSKSEIQKLSDDDQTKYFEQQELNKLREDLRKLGASQNEDHSGSSNKFSGIEDIKLYEDYPEFIVHKLDDKQGGPYYFFIVKYKSKYGTTNVDASSIMECDYAQYFLDRSNYDPKTDPCHPETMFKNLDIFTSNQLSIIGKSLIDKKAHITYGKYSDASRLRDRLLKNSSTQ